MSIRFGKYEVETEIGHGAFGRVYRAYDPQMGRRVAIKVLVDQDPEMLARLRSEAGTAGNLSHKNIVTVYEYGEDEGKPYIVMELLEGENLQEIITRQPALSMIEKVRIIAQVAEGLGAAHDHGIVHRDIKPANIMVSRDGDVKIMDFGIARIAGEDQTRMTSAGDLIGTILYMSPERIRGADADACADIFAFGVVCYEFLTGRNPFDGKVHAAVIYNITSVDPPAVREVIPECPEILDLMIRRAMAKDREIRYQTMAEILFDLSPVLLDLARQWAASLTRQAEELVEKGDLAQAQEKIGGALELDPANPDGRRLHEYLVKEHRRRVVKKRVEGLWREGTAELEQRHFTEAIVCFEAALRLDPSDEQSRWRLDEAKMSLEANRRASRLISEARSEMAAGELDAAYERAAAALEADPTSSDAVGLLEDLRRSRHAGLTEHSEVALAGERDRPEQKKDLAAGFDLHQAETERLEAERRLAEERSRRISARQVGAEALLAAGSEEQALAAAQSALYEFPGEPVFVQLRQRVLEQLAVRIRERLANGDLDEAGRKLASYPFHLRNEPLWRELDVELKRKRVYNALLAEAEQLCNQHDYDAAQGKLREALATDPLDSRAEQLLEQLRAGTPRGFYGFRSRLQRFFDKSV